MKLKYVFAIIIFLLLLFFIRNIYFNDLRDFPINFLIENSTIQFPNLSLDDSYLYESFLGKDRPLAFFSGGLALDLAYKTPLYFFTFFNNFNVGIYIFLNNITALISIILLIPKNKLLTYVLFSPYLAYLSVTLNKEIWTLNFILFFVYILNKKFREISLIGQIKPYLIKGIYKSILIFFMLSSIFSSFIVFLGRNDVFIGLISVTIFIELLDLRRIKKRNVLILIFLIPTALAADALLNLKLIESFISWFTARNDVSLFDSITGMLYAPFAPFPLGIFNFFNQLFNYAVEGIRIENVNKYLLEVFISTYLAFLGFKRFLLSFNILEKSIFQRKITLSRFPKGLIPLFVSSFAIGFGGKNFTRQVMPVVLVLGLLLEFYIKEDNYKKYNIKL